MCLPNADRFCCGLAAIAFTQIGVAAVGIEEGLDIPAMIHARGGGNDCFEIAIAADAQLVMRSIGCGDCGKAAAERGAFAAGDWSNSG